MYNDHFGLQRAPFKITPDPGLFYAGGRRGEILEALVYAVTSGEGIIKVVGEVGVGKTMLCRMLEVRLPGNVETVYLANPSLSPEDILQAIAMEMEIEVEAGGNRLKALHRIHQHLLDKHVRNEHVVVLVEEAQSMPNATLEEIRLLSNLETGQSKLLQIVLFGQPELDEKLADPSIRQLRERITHSFELQPLSFDEVREYVDFRLRQVGYRGREAFQRGAYRKIAKASSGLTRRVNILADKALLAAYAEDTYDVSPRHALIAIRDSDYIARLRVRWPELMLGLGAAMLLLALGTLWWVRGDLGRALGVEAIALAPPALALPSPPGTIGAIPGQRPAPPAVSSEVASAHIQEEAVMVPASQPPSAEVAPEGEMSAAVRPQVSDVVGGAVLAAPLVAATSPPLDDGARIAPEDRARTDPLTLSESVQSPPAVKTVVLEGTQEPSRVAGPVAQLDVYSIATQPESTVREVQPESRVSAMQRESDVSAPQLKSDTSAMRRGSDESAAEIPSAELSAKSVANSASDESLREDIRAEFWLAGGSLVVGTAPGITAARPAARVESKVSPLTAVSAAAVKSASADADTSVTASVVREPATLVAATSLVAQRLQATRLWLSRIDGSHYSIQLLLTDISRRENLEVFLRGREQAGELDDVYVYETVINRRTWFGVLYREYSSFSEARRALEKLPPELSLHAPFIRNVRDISTVG